MTLYVVQDSDAFNEVLFGLRCGKQTQEYCIRENKVYMVYMVCGAFPIYRSASVAQKGLYSDNPKPFNSANFIHFDDPTNLSDPPTNGKWI